MSSRLPPLTALRAFEAAARHLSFARAADELAVTPAALSFQIRHLEEHLGQPLFRRLNRAVELTEAGRLLAPGASEGFETLALAWRAALRAAGGRQLVVTAGPAFTALWLAPRLFAFAAAHPEIELRFIASLRLLDLARAGVDIAIRFGEASTLGEPGLTSIELVREWWTPMVAPALAGDLRAPADLARLPLLHQDDTDFLEPRPDWAAWFAAAGLDPPPPGGPHFSQADHAIGAALAGAGAILGRGSLTEAALREGRLVAPFRLALRGGAGYRLLYPSGSETRPAVAAFADWVRAETASIADLAAASEFAEDPA